MTSERGPDARDDDPPSRIELGAASVALAAAAAVTASRRLADFDLPWHLAFGRIVVQTRSFPETDDLASTHFPIKYAEVVSDVLLYAAHAAGGALGLQVLGGVVAAAIAVLTYARARRYGAIAFPAAALAVAGIEAWLIVRPATIGFALAALCMLLVEAHRRHPDERRGRFALGGLAVLQLLWCNMHQSGAIGAALAVGYLLYRAAARTARGRSPAVLPARDGTHLGCTAIAAVLAVAATTMNRNGVRYFPNPFDYKDLAPFATEWATTSWPLLAREPIATGALAVVVSSILAGRDPDTKARTPQAFDVALVVFSLLLCVYFRLVPLAIVLTMPVAARRLSAYVPRAKTVRLACVASTFAAAPLLYVRHADPPGVGFLARHFPEGAVQYIERERPEGPMWNFSPFGGYLEWRLYPRYRPLIDGRVFDVPWAARVNATEFDAGEFQALARERGLEWAVCRASEGERFCVAPSELADWTMVYWDDASAIYVRASGPNARLAERGYRIFKHLDPIGEILRASIDAPDLAERIAHDGELAVDQAPESARAIFLGACAALARRDGALFDRRVEALARIAPGSAPLQALREARAMAQKRR